MGLLFFGAGGRGRLSLRTLWKVISPSLAPPLCLALNQGAVGGVDLLFLEQEEEEGQV